MTPPSTPSLLQRPFASRRTRERFRQETFRELKDEVRRIEERSPGSLARYRTEAARRIEPKLRRFLDELIDAVRRELFPQLLVDCVWKTIREHLDGLKLEPADFRLRGSILGMLRPGPWPEHSVEVPKPAECLLQFRFWLAGYRALRLAGQWQMAGLLMVHWWHYLAAVQLQESDHIYRALPAFHLGVHHLEQENRNSAYHWFLLAFIDDVLNLPPSERPSFGPKSLDLFGSADYLALYFGVSSARLSAIARTILENADQNGLPEGLRRIRQFAEYHYGTLVSTEPLHHGSYADAHWSPNQPVTSVFVAAFWEWLHRDMPHDPRGKEFERLAAYLFTTVNGLTLQADVVPDDRSNQTDLLARPGVQPSATLAGLGASSFLVECKWMARRVESHQVGHLAARMLASDVRTGLLLTRKGLTGDGQAGSGQYARAFKGRLRPGLRIASLVLDRSLVESLCGARSDHSNRQGELALDPRALRSLVHSRPSQTFDDALYEAFKRSSLE